MDKEFEIGIGIDISGYSEKKTDLAIDKKVAGGQTIKQQNSIFSISIKQKKKNISEVLFEEK